MFPFVGFFVLAALFVLIAFVMDRLQRSGFLYYLEALRWGDNNDSVSSNAGEQCDSGGGSGDA